MIEVGNNQEKTEKEEGLPVFGGGGQTETNTERTQSEFKNRRPIRHAASF